MVNTNGNIFRGNFQRGALAAPTPADKTPPVITPLINGIQGSNGWYTSNVIVSWNMSDPQSSVVNNCEAVALTEETSGIVLACTAINGNGLPTTATTTIKIEKTAPDAQLAITAGTPNQSGWYTSDVTISTTGNDSVSTSLACTSYQFQTNNTTCATFNGACTNDAGLTTNADPLIIKLDKRLQFPPTLTTNNSLNLATSLIGIIRNYLLITDDAGTQPDQIIYAISTGPTQGALQLKGISPVTSFAQSDINADALS
jgi:hypothetical protein